jgi:hypothetical protein
MDNFDAVRELPVKPKTDSPVNPSGEPERARVSGVKFRLLLQRCLEAVEACDDAELAAEVRAAIREDA